MSWQEARGRQIGILKGGGEDFETVHSTCIVELRHAFSFRLFELIISLFSAMWGEREQGFPPFHRHCLPSTSVGVCFGGRPWSWVLSTSVADLCSPGFSLQSHSNANTDLNASHFLLVLNSRNGHQG